MKRRDFLKSGVKVGVAMNALPFVMGGSRVMALGRSPLRSALEASGTTNDNVLVIIQLAGGNDGLNTLVPVTDALYKQYRPTLGLDKTVDKLLALKDHNTLMWNGSMTGISSLYDAGKVAVLQNVGYPSPNLSHFRGTDIWNTATDSNLYATTGWIGRLLYDQDPTYPPVVIPAGSAPPAIQFGNALSNIFLGDNGGMGIAISRVPTAENKSIHNYDDIPSNPTVPFEELEYVRIIQRETEVYTTTMFNRSVQTNKITYPAGNTLATQLASVAQLIASGFSTKIYLVTQGGYDTHSNQATDQPNLLGDLSDAVLAFQQDLEQFGVADKVAMMTYSEFGRRPQENGSGTDHGTAAPLFVIGTKVIGKVYGNDPKLDAASLVSGNLAYDPNHDFRNVYSTVLNEWLLSGAPDADRAKDIQDVLTSSNGVTYSKNSTWQSLGIFQSAPQQAVKPTEAAGFMLMQNYPNPFTDRTTIEFALPENGPVELSVWNTAGQQVALIADGRRSAGIYRETFNSSNLPNGTYLYRLKTPTAEVTRQMVVVR